MMNVIGTRPTGWWRDRDAAARRLVGRLQQLAASEGTEITAVLDGRPLPDLPEGEHQGVRIFYARRPGRDAADYRIIELVEADPDPASMAIVTSDRGLAGRIRAAGAEVSSPTRLLARLDPLEM